MSIYDKASLIQIPSGYKAGKLYSVIPNSGAGDFTVTGDAEGDATRVNSQGLIETVNANVPRLDYPFIDGVVQDCPRLLLEPQRTNSLIYSKDFTQWTKQNLTATSNELISPNGSQNADKILETTANSFHFAYNGILSATPSTDYTYSIFVKKLGRQYVGIQTLFNTVKGAIALFDLDNGSLAYTFQQGGHTVNNANIYNYNNDWYRITATFQVNDSTAVFGLITADDLWTTGTAYNNPYIGDVTKGVYVYGAQVEQGSYPTSYISTNGSSVTRLKDECTNGGNADLFNVTEGTLFLDVYDFKSSANPEITLSSGSATNRITLVYYPSSNQLRFYITSNNVVQADQFVSYTYSQRNKIALRYKQNDFKAYINGTQVFSDTSGNTPIGLSRFDFSKYDQTNGFLEGEVYQTMIFNEALSDSELQTLTTL